MQSIIKNEFEEHYRTSISSLESNATEIEIAAKICIECLQNNNKLLIFGNGGSASDAQHIAAEIIGRYKLDRKGYPAIALNTDTSALTAIGNDFGYSNIFERQVEALANSGDVLIGISTSGSSLNVIKALKLAKVKGCKSIGMSGKEGGEFIDICDLNILVPSNDTARIQEMHILIGHIICNLIDINLS